jgi:hypothetical protein
LPAVNSCPAAIKADSYFLSISPVFFITGFTSFQLAFVFKVKFRYFNQQRYRAGIATNSQTVVMPGICANRNWQPS